MVRDVGTLVEFAPSQPSPAPAPLKTRRIPSPAPSTKNSSPSTRRSPSWPLLRVHQQRLLCPAPTLWDREDRAMNLPFHGPLRIHRRGSHLRDAGSAAPKYPSSAPMPFPARPPCAPDSIPPSSPPSRAVTGSPHALSTPPLLSTREGRAGVGAQRSRAST